LPSTIWATTTLPALASADDPQAVEVGLKFRSDLDGYITGIRFYRGDNNGGTHVGHLWAADGTLLGTTVFGGETATGWEQASFATPVAIRANTTYVASYFAPEGGYAFDGGYFATAGAGDGPLHALADGADGANGVYLYGSSGGFPTNSFGAGNYWVDVVFSLTPGGDGTPSTTSLAVSLASPADGSVASGAVRLSAAVPDGVGAAGVQFLLDGKPLGPEVTTAPYSLSWDSTTVRNGTHTLQARVSDAGRSTVTSAPITVTVSNVRPAHTYYVATTGSDSNNGSARSPWRTLQNAADQVQAGDTVVVRAGSYAGFIMGWDTPTAGEAGAPITFEADPAAAPGSVVINAQNSKTHVGIDLEPGCDYITIAGFTIVGAGGIATYPNKGSGIKVTGNNDSVLGNTVTGIDYGFGITSDGANFVVIRNNTVSGTGNHGNADYGHGIYVAGSTDGAVVVGNVLHDNAYIGLHINGDASTTGGNGLLTHALIAGNRIYNNGQNGINADGIQSSVIENNLIYGYQGFGIALYQIDASGPSANNVIVNNTVVSTVAGAGAAVRILDAGTGNALLNNILLGGGGIAYRISSDSLPGLVSDYNIGGGLYQSEDSGATQSLAQWQAQTGQDGHSFTATAGQLFVNAAANDYHLSATSPALDQAAALDAPGTDLDGIPRPPGAVQDVGAYGGPLHLSIDAPAVMTAGTSIGLTVRVLDHHDNVVTGYTRTVAFTGSDTSGLLPGSYAFTPADAGVHVFTGTLRRAGGYAIAVSDAAADATAGAAAVTVNPAAASTLALSGLPPATTAGMPFKVTVTALDRFGNIAKGYAGKVRFASSDAAALLPAAYSFAPADGGTHKFSVTLRTGGRQALAVSDSAAPALRGLAGVTVGRIRTVTTAALSVTRRGLAEVVTLTISVSGGAPGVAPPTGTVTLLDGVTPLGSARLLQGRAVITAALAPGAHLVTAVYGGDGTFLASRAPAIAVVGRLVWGRGGGLLAAAYEPRRALVAFGRLS
jgi:hypothetical protein